MTASSSSTDNPSALFCPQCRAPLDTGVKFCGRCGLAVPQPSVPPRPQRAMSHLSGARQWLPLTLAALSVLIMATVLWLTPVSNAPTAIPLPAANAPDPQTADRATAERSDKGAMPQGHDPPNAAEALRLNDQGLQLAKEEKLEEAARSFQQAVVANPGHAPAWNNLGLALRRLGRLNEAIQAYERAIEAQPLLAVAHKNLGLALEQIGKPSQAAQALRRYCELNPTANDVASVRTKIAVLEGSDPPR